MTEISYVWVKDNEYIAIDFASGGYVYFTTALSGALHFDTLDEAQSFKEGWAKNGDPYWCQTNRWLLHEVLVRPV